MQFAKGAPFTLTPDTANPKVYDDEEVNFFVNKYGLASAGSGVNAYEIDNEPSLWPDTHPHPSTANHVRGGNQKICCIRGSGKSG